MREACGKVAREEVGRLGVVQEILIKKYGQSGADHCASRWKETSHLVVCLTALQQFPLGGLHLVGIDRTRRQQQQEEEAPQLVESTHQDSGGAVRHKRR